MGDFDVSTLVGAESLMRYHSIYVANLIPVSRKTVSVGQFTWGGCLLKSNGGVQRFACHGWKPWLKCIRISKLDCETDRSNR